MIAAVVALVIGYLVTHDGDQPRTLPARRSWNVIGYVRKVQFLPGFRHDPADIAATSDPQLAEGRTFTIGPAVLSLSNGRRLAIKARTPGANQCLHLLTTADRLAVTGMSAPDGLDPKQIARNGGGGADCWIIGQSHNGVLSWFAVLNPRDVGAIVSIERNRALTSRGFEFDLAKSVKVDCWTSLRKIPAQSTYNTAAIDPTNATVTSVRCFGTA